MEAKAKILFIRVYEHGKRIWYEVRYKDGSVCIEVDDYGVN